VGKLWPVGNTGLPTYFNWPMTSYYGKRHVNSRSSLD